MIPQLILLAVLLMLSAFFSGSETSFFSLNHLEKEKLLTGTKGARKKFISRILSRPADILVTILTGNMIVNFYFASTMDVVVGERFGHYGWLYSILIGTLLVLIFGEMTPKNLAIRHSLSFFTFSSPILAVMHRLLTPFRFVLTRIERGVISLITSRMNPEADDSRNLISSTFQLGLQKGIIHHSEHSTLESFLDFREKTAEDVMIPRTEMNAVDASTSLKNLLASLHPDEHEPLIPVYKEDIDHIVGYINIRDILPFRYNLDTRKTLMSILKNIHPVPESKNLMDLLREIMENRCEMALVIDEYGGTAGIVTYQTLVEDFLYFFYHPQEEFRRVGEDTFIFPGSFELDRAGEILEIDFEAESRTVSGYMIEILEDIPEPGQELQIDDLLFIVRSVSRKKILEVEIRKI
ncbi:MAG: HlyC/CorC family transporter [Spirochaetales bacterium]|jgi:putative hemolysin|nr:HlyC/CorC family transporter [Spirochaetales bacterium]